MRSSAVKVSDSYHSDDEENKVAGDKINYNAILYA
jgi:hypothetical protein